MAHCSRCGAVRGPCQRETCELKSDIRAREDWNDNVYRTWHDARIKQAVRTVRRIWAPLSIEYAKGAELAAQFDGGEYSGPASARAEEQAHNEVIEKVAGKFSIDAQELRDAVQNADNHEGEMFLRSIDDEDYRTELEHKDAR